MGSFFFLLHSLSLSISDSWWEIQVYRNNGQEIPQQIGVYYIPINWLFALDVHMYESIYSQAWCYEENVHTYTIRRLIPISFPLSLWLCTVVGISCETMRPDVASFSSLCISMGHILFIFMHRNDICSYETIASKALWSPNPRADRTRLLFSYTHNTNPAIVFLHPPWRSYSSHSFHFTFVHHNIHIICMCLGEVRFSWVSSTTTRRRFSHIVTISMTAASLLWGTWRVVVFLIL